jgi:hypothetical protein
LKESRDDKTAIELFISGGRGLRGRVAEILCQAIAPFFPGPALPSGGFISVGLAGGEAAMQEFSIGAGRGKA